MSFTVIIPSRDVSNLVACVDAIHRNTRGQRLIVIDDGLDLIPWPVSLDGSTILKGEKPFIFSRNCNLGIKACDGDVILLNDDAMLETSGGFELLSEASKANPQFGVISAVTNLVGNQAQRPQGKGLREEARMVCFVCVYIPRRTIETVGLLDEEFIGYGFEDDSYCLRVRRAGLKIGIFDDCFVDHNSLKSTFRDRLDAGYPNDGFRQNQAIFRQKYGAGNHEL